jgi:hypothetical protein
LQPVYTILVHMLPTEFVFTSARRNSMMRGTLDGSTARLEAKTWHTVYYLQELAPVGFPLSRYSRCAPREGRSHLAQHSLSHKGESHSAIKTRGHSAMRGERYHSAMRSERSLSHERREGVTQPLETRGHSPMRGERTRPIYSLLKRSPRTTLTLSRQRRSRRGRELGNLWWKAMNGQRGKARMQRHRSLMKYQTLRVVSLVCR